LPAPGPGCRAVTVETGVTARWTKTGRRRIASVAALGAADRQVDAMVTRGRRWVAIVLCFGIPVAIVFTAWRDDTPAAGVDPLLPPKCVAVRQQATTDPAGAADAAKKIVADPSATIE